MNERGAEMYRYLKTIRETTLYQRGVEILNVLIKNREVSQMQWFLASLLAFDLESHLAACSVQTSCKEARVWRVSSVDAPAVRRAALARLCDLLQTRNLEQIGREISDAKESAPKALKAAS